MDIVGECLLLSYIPEDIIGPHLTGRFQKQTAVSFFIVIHCQMTVYDTIEIKPGMPMDWGYATFAPPCNHCFTAALVSKYHCSAILSLQTREIVEG